VGLLLVAAACGGKGSDSTVEVCPPEQRTGLLAEQVDHLTPTNSFTIGAGAAAYVMVTFRSPDAGPFDRLGGVASLAIIADGASPKLRRGTDGLTRTDDQKVEIRRSLQWQRVPLSPGSYRVYSMAGAPTIEIVSCPA
jgi:hypothetical protein